jgi:crossover junction endodeoxyribonuclease RusA
MKQATSPVKQATFSVDGKVQSLNAERKAHWSKRAEQARLWRERFWAEGLKQRVRFERVEITVEIAQKRLMDAGNAYPTIKAAIDGLVDARVIPDDTPKHVAQITLLAPVRVVTEPERLTLTLKEA